MSANKKAVRKSFRLRVFTRDGYRCAKCGKPGQDRQCEVSTSDLVELDAHHITSRDLMPNGGYVPENGISLCPDCHIEAEAGTIPADELYRIIGSTFEKAYAASEAL